MEVYEKSTMPLIDFYQQRGLLLTLSAEGTPEDIYQRAATALNRARTTPALSSALAGQTG